MGHARVICTQNMLARIYLMRHSGTERSRSVQHTNRTDIPLTGRGDGEAGEGRMESAVIVTAEVKVLHPAGDVGGLVGRLRDAPVGGGDARHADRGQQQEDQSWFGRQHAMIQGEASIVRTSATGPKRKAPKVRRFQCCTCSG